MAMLGEYFLAKALVLSENIVRRVVLRSGEEASARVGPAVCQTLEDVMSAIEKETKQILDGLASQQQSKIDSACQYIRFAMSDLQAWSNEVDTKPTPQLGKSGAQSVNVLQLNVGTNMPVESKYLKDAIWQLRQADEWATEAFNDKKNSSLLVRVEALHIRLFCRALLDWDNKRLWFAKWRQVLEPFLADRQTLRVLTGEQSLVSKLLTEQRVQAAAARLIQLTKGLEALIWRLLLQQPSLVPHAVELAQYFDKQTTLAADLKPGSQWSGMRSFHITYLDLNDDIQLKLCASHVLVRFYEFRRLAPALRSVWGVETGGRLVQIDPCDPSEQTLVVNDGRSWSCPAYAANQRRMYVSNDTEAFLTIFDVTTGQQLSERVPMPESVFQSYVYDVLASVNGDLLLFHKGNGRMFLRPVAERSRHWLPLEQRNQTKLECAYDALATHRGCLYGLRMSGNCLITDRIDIVGDHATIGQSNSFQLHLDVEPDTRCFVVVPPTTDVDVQDQTIVVLCQTEKNNSIVTLRRSPDEPEAHRFARVQVEQFDKYHLDWPMAKQVIMMDDKLYVC